MIGFIFGLARAIITILEIAMLVYMVMNLLRMDNRLRQALRQVLEPILVPLRGLLARFIPAKYLVVDWSPLAAMVLLGIISCILQLIRG